MLSTEELEDLVNVGKEVGLRKLLLEKESTADIQQQDFREFLRDVAARESLNFSNALVAAATHRIFEKLGIPD